MNPLRAIKRKTPEARRKRVRLVDWSFIHPQSRRARGHAAHLEHRENKNERPFTGLRIHKRAPRWLTVRSVPKTGNNVFALDPAKRNNSGRRDMGTKGLPGGRIKIIA